MGGRQGEAEAREGKEGGEEGCEEARLGKGRKVRRMTVEEGREGR